MKNYDKPHFIIKKELQKSSITGIYFKDIITENILKEVTKKITDQESYTVEFVDNDYSDDFLPKSYNKGRMAIMLYKDVVNFISFSEKEIAGRNSGVQSVPTAFNMFYNCKYPKKKLYYYFIHESGNAETDYYLLIYRLMLTIGFNILNPEALNNKIFPFTSIEDIMYSRQINSGRNSSNNSTYITKSGHQQYDVYGKTYGANKYETSMFCYALSKLANPNDNIVLYEVLEKDLKELPQSCLEVISSMGIVKVIPTDMQLEKKVFEENDSLRSPRYIYNLLEKMGRKHCAFCDCEIPELIQGAHVWPVANIKKNQIMNFDKKLECATDGENGLWLCENHHKLFDENIITINDDGILVFDSSLEMKNLEYIQNVTTNIVLPENILTDKFLYYLKMRNDNLVTN